MKALTFRIALLLGTMAMGVQAGDSANVDAILAKYVAALGGKPALEKITSRTFKGRIQIAGAAESSDWEFCSKAPNRQWSHAELAGVGEITDGFDGVVAWSKSPFGGLRVKSGEELAKVKRDADFYRDLKLKALYPGLALKGTDKVDEEAVQVLESRPSPASLERFCFATKTGLLLKQESEFDGPDGKVHVTVRPSDYRQVNGILYPHLMKCSLEAGGQTFEFSLRFVEVRHNLAVDDARFAKPSS